MAPENQVKKEEPTGNVSISLEQFQLLMQTLISESRKPVIDPIKEKQRVRQKEHNRQLQKDALQNLIRKFDACNHMQRPGSIMTGCSAVAWATQSDGRVRGTCQHCGTVFSPVKDECLTPEIHEAYKQLIRIPTHPAGNISWESQHA